METTPPEEEQKKPEVSPDVPTDENPVPDELAPFSGQETVLHVPLSMEPATPSEPTPIEESTPPPVMPEEPSPAVPSEIPTGEYRVSPEPTPFTGQETVLHISSSIEPAAAEIPPTPSLAPEDQPVFPLPEEPSPAAPSDIPTGEVRVSPEQVPSSGQQADLQAFHIPEPPPAEEAITPAVEHLEEPPSIFPPAYEPPPAQAYPIPEQAEAKPYPLPPQPAQAIPYPPAPQQAYRPPYSAAAAARPPKDRTLAMILEPIPGLFGFLGIGWLVAGNTTVGIILLVAFLAWNFIALILDVVTVGIFACLHVPANLIAVVLSTILLYNYTKQHPELFGP